MKYAILAAGEGSRLVSEGVELPKPLVRLHGEAMIDRLMRIFMDNDAEEIFVITNNLTPLIQQHLYQVQNSGLPLRIVVKTTPSSMHSFYELRQIMGNGPFCLTTVDTIFREDEFRRYISAFRSLQPDGLMAVTDYIDDEKPLYISTTDSMDITGFHDTFSPGIRFISGGIYCLSHTSYPTLDRCMERGMSRMRNFQRQLVADGLHLCAYPFSKILDVDHAADIAKAEDFLSSCDTGDRAAEPKPETRTKPRTFSIVFRESHFSPNMVDKDAAILQAVARNMQRKGYKQNDDIECADIVFTMSREPKMLERLGELERRGVTVINSPAAVTNCNRVRFTRLFVNHHIPIPHSTICTPDKIPELSLPLWIKKGDGYSERPEDVMYAESTYGVEAAMQKMSSLGNSVLVVSEHARGDLVKFYGVRRTRFFRWYYAADGHSKFGHETINGQPSRFDFDTNALQTICHRAASVLGIDVYGGDVVVSPGGHFTIIDFNDWPSFSQYKDEAADAISQLVEVCQSRGRRGQEKR